MSEQDRARLKAIHTFPALVKYLREDLGWPVEQESFEDLTFDWEPGELGIDASQAAKIEYIKQLRPLENGQPQGVFFVKFDTKNLPVVALRRLLGKLVVKKRATAAAAERPLWAMRDLVFISSYGESSERQLSFAYFQDPEHSSELPSLKVLGWDDKDTPLHLDKVHDLLESHLTWPDRAKALAEWRKGWSHAFELRHGEVVSTAKQLAEQLAALARRIRERANQLLRLETDTGPLRTLMAGFKTALIHDLTEDQFADMYAQTVAYGLLSARITHPDPVKVETLPDLIPVTNPFLKELMETFVLAGGKHRGHRKGVHLDFDELGINDVVELLRRANMKAVLENFGNEDRKEDPVTYFYEDFLNAYDAKERKRRGVYYTPKPVVSYIVRSVHELLQTEFGIEDGLASTITWGEMAKRPKDLKIPEGVGADSPFVQILDPATGTATFLVEVIDVMLTALKARWTKEGLSEAKQVEAWNAYVPKHLLPRLYGYELMMAPYAIAHLKIGLKLFATGYRFGSNERARIYLTNALEPASDASNSQIDALSEALAHEADAVNDVKRTKRFSVVVGNPPYSGVSSNMSEESQRLVDVYKIVDGHALNERKVWLQDDYVKFIRKAQTTIETANSGVLGYITNHSYLDNPTFRGMRQSLVGTFPSLRALDLHGNTTRSEHPPGGIADKNVFDIQQGVAIVLATRGAVTCGVEHADLWGSREEKYAWLEKHDVGNTRFAALNPDSPYYFFEPQNTDYRAEYDCCWKINEAMPLNCAGFITARDHFVVDIDKDALLSRISDFADSKRTDAAIRAAYFSGRGSGKYPDGDTRGWKVPVARRRVASDKQWRDRVRVCSYRPFDRRPVYWADWMIDWPRPEVSGHMLAGRNVAFHVCRQSVSEEWSHILVARGLIDDCYVSNKSRERGYAHPLYLYEADGGLALGNVGEPNFAPAFLRDLSTLLELPQSKPHGLPRGLTVENIFNYAYAVLHDPGYRRRYAELLKIDFPRLPLTTNLELFRALSRFGGELVALHLMESPKLDNFMTTYTGPRNPEVGRVGWSDDTVWLDAESTKKGQPCEPGTIGFKGVPEDVWNFNIGGYQVCEKWHKDRKGRKLSKDDIEHYQKIVVALSETIRIMKEIDEVIERHGGWPGAFQTKSANIPAI